ncbi:hypothetical protein PR048_025638 [Dryococelus australis]|uniref:Uncharacterized protein n=1 Tax=Dryococelus australis TaxID=614101 RepID=A0ABQ9GRV5_9NEOP|nr:hypothetical protein PR048_025638 [Dryococelus australis]
MGLRFYNESQEKILEKFVVSNNLSSEYCIEALVSIAVLQWLAKRAVCSHKLNLVVNDSNQVPLPL